MTNDPGERLLTVDEAAAILRCHPDTVRSLYRSHQLSITRVGRLVRITPEALQAYLAATSTTSTCTTDERTEQ